MKTPLAPLFLSLALWGCTSTEEDPEVDPNAEQEVDADEYGALVAAALWADDMSVTLNDGVLTVADDGLPSHSVLEAYALFNGTTTPVSDSAYSFDIPMNPALADTKTDTSLGAIGVAISGGLFFDPYEGDGTTVALDGNFEADGIPFIDACNGHPLDTGTTYHYHGVPYCITDDVDTAGMHSVLIGVLFDGFAIYGPLGVDGEVPSDLDECNGHSGITPEFPEGMYHYHLSESTPYMMTCYSGTPSVENDGGGPGGGGPGGGGGALVECAEGQTMCCGDGVCDGPETFDNCSEDCS